MADRQETWTSFDNWAIVNTTGSLFALYDNMGNKRGVCGSLLNAMLLMDQLQRCGWRNVTTAMKSPEQGDTGFEVRFVK